MDTNSNAVQAKHLFKCQDAVHQLSQFQGAGRFTEIAVELAEAQARAEVQRELLDALRAEVAYLRQLTRRLAGVGR